MLNVLLENTITSFYVSPVGVEIEDNGIRETNVDYRDLIDFTISNLIDAYINIALKILIHYQVAPKNALNKC